MKSLKQDLASQLHKAKRVLVLGVGSELRADDAAGVIVAKNLTSFKPSKKSAVKFLSIIGETAPENFTGDIKKFKPTHLVIVDSADMGKVPGSVGIFDAKNELYGVSFCTHSLPIKVMNDYLLNFIKCEIILIGIQPKLIKFGKPCSSIIRKTSVELADLLKDIINQKNFVGN